MPETEELTAARWLYRTALELVHQGLVRIVECPERGFRCDCDVCLASLSLETTPQQPQRPLPERTADPSLPDQGQMTLRPVHTNAPRVVIYDQPTRPEGRVLALQSEAAAAVAALPRLSGAPVPALPSLADIGDEPTITVPGAPRQRLQVQPLQVQRVPALAEADALFESTRPGVGHA